MMKGGHGQTNQLHNINWGALNHGSRASQLMSCNYYVYEAIRHPRAHHAIAHVQAS